MAMRVLNASHYEPGLFECLRPEIKKAGFEVGAEFVVLRREDYDEMIEALGESSLVLKKGGTEPALYQARRNKELINQLEQEE